MSYFSNMCNKAYIFHVFQIDQPLTLCSRKGIQKFYFKDHFQNSTFQITFLAVGDGFKGRLMWSPSTVSLLAHPLLAYNPIMKAAIGFNNIKILIFITSRRWFNFKSIPSMMLLSWWCFEFRINDLTMNMTTMSFVLFEVVNWMMMVISASRITSLASPNPTQVTVIHNYWISRDIVFSICNTLAF